jgi:methionyl-tRNA formyltransferase
MESITESKPIERIVFMGAPEFATPTLRRLAESGRTPQMVVTQPDRPQGRSGKPAPTPVKIVAESLGIPVGQPDSVNEPGFVGTITDLAPDLIVTAAYGGFLGKALLNLPRFGCINLHPSLLPLYRGAAPIPFALFDGRIITGVTVFRMVKAMDAGPILMQRATPIDPKENASDLLRRLSVSGAGLVLETIAGLETGLIVERPQEEALASYTTKIEKADTFLRWDRPVAELLNRIRGLADEPGALCRFRGKWFKILCAKELKSQSDAEPGTILEVIKNLGFRVAANGTDLLVHYIHPEGKKAMFAWDYHLGARVTPGERFEAID